LANKFSNSKFTSYSYDEYALKNWKTNSQDRNRFGYGTTFVCHAEKVTAKFHTTEATDQPPEKSVKCCVQNFCKRFASVRRCP